MMTNKQEFRVGDRIEIVRASEKSAVPPSMIGWSGVVQQTVAQTEDWNRRLRVRTDQDGCLWYILPEDIRRASPAEPAKGGWVEVDRNETHVLWQSSLGIQTIWHRSGSGPNAICAPPDQGASDYRAELGQSGFRYRTDRSDWVACEGYIPRDPTEDSPVVEPETLAALSSAASGNGETSGGRVVPSGANSGRYNGNDLERERLMCAEMRREDELPLTLGGPSRRDNLLSGLRSEQPKPRRHNPKYDPRPCDRWPAGDERNEA